MVATLDDQVLVPVDAAVGTQLGEQELDDVFGLPVELLADLANVGPDGALVAFTMDRGRRDGVAFLAGAAGQCRVGDVKRLVEAAE